MFVRLKHSKRTVHPTVQIVESVREGAKVKQRVIASLGSVQDEKDLDRLNALAQSMMTKLQEERTRQRSLFSDWAEPTEKKLAEVPPKRDPKQSSRRVAVENLAHHKTVHDGFITVIDRLFTEVGFDKVRVKGNRTLAFDPLQIAKILVAQRFYTPASKLRTFERQNDLGVDGLKLHHIYRGMDLLLRADNLFQERAKAIACPPGSPLFKETVECLFVDVTTLYFESVKTDEVRQFGFSKDQKHHSVQAVLCLAVNDKGVPVSYEIFSGNTAEVSTVVPMVKNIKKRFDVEKITIVCDRGLASKANIEKFQELGFGYVAACKIKHLPAALKLNDLSLFDDFEAEPGEDLKVRRLPHPRYPDSDLIVTWSKKRACKDKSDRDRILAKLNTKLGKNEKSEKIKKLVTNHGYRSYVKTDGKGSWQIDEDAAAKAASWDGFHAITVAKESGLNTEDALAQYKNLWRIEEAFRVAKTYLEIRPMFHWTPERIKGHVLICFIGLFLERFLEQQLKLAGKKLTPDRIRLALQNVHTIHFQDAESGQFGIMQSSLTDDAKAIFETLSLPTKRGTKLL